MTKDDLTAIELEREIQYLINKRLQRLFDEQAKAGLGTQLETELTKKIAYTTQAIFSLGKRLAKYQSNPEAALKHTEQYEKVLAKASEPDGRMARLVRYSQLPVSMEVLAGEYIANAIYEIKKQAEEASTHGKRHTGHTRHKDTVNKAWHDWRANTNQPVTIQGKEYRITGISSNKQGTGFDEVVAKVCGTSPRTIEKWRLELGLRK